MAEDFSEGVEYFHIVTNILQSHTPCSAALRPTYSWIVKIQIVNLSKQFLYVVLVLGVCLCVVGELITYVYFVVVYSPHFLCIQMRYPEHCWMFCSSWV